jgi:hypothetical protein
MRGRTESERGNLLSLAFRFSTGWRHRGRLTCSIAVQSMTPARICGFALKESDLRQESSHLRGNLAPRLGVYPVDPQNIQEKRENVSIILKGAC